MVGHSAAYAAQHHGKADRDTRISGFRGAKLEDDELSTLREQLYRRLEELWDDVYNEDSQESRHLPHYKKLLRETLELAEEFGIDRSKFGPPE